MNNISVKRVPFHKHLGLIVDSKLYFNKHINTVLSNVNKKIALLQNLQYTLLRHLLLTKCKISFDYGDVMFNDKVFNESIRKKIEPVQYNAALPMTVSIRRTNTEKLYQELGLQSLQNRRKLRMSCLFYKIYEDHTPPYFHNLIQSFYSLWATEEIPLFRVNQNFLKVPFSINNDWME